MMHQDVFTELNDADRAALELAIQMMLREADDVRVEQARSFMASDWLDGAQFCARYQQRKALLLKTWEFAPCELGSELMEQFLARGADHPEAGHGYRTALLLQKMRQHGVSDYHPDPMAALEAMKP